MFYIVPVSKTKKKYFIGFGFLRPPALLYFTEVFLSVGLLCVPAGGEMLPFKNKQKTLPIK